MGADFFMVVGVVILFFLFLFIFTVFLVILLSYFRRYTPPEGYEPYVSIIIPCYNEEKNIKKCLDSVHASSYPEDKLEIIVVDDGSTDKTLSILKDYRKLSLKIVQGSHGGKSESLNLGVSKASYDIILTLDADTALTRFCISKSVCYFSDESVGATNGSCSVLNKDSFLGTFQLVEYNYNNLIRKGFSDIFNNAIWFFGAFACYRKKVLEDVGGFKKDNSAEDMDIALSIYSKGYRIVNVHDALVYTRVPSTLLALIKQRIRWWGGVLLSLRKNKSLFSKKSDPSIWFLFINQYWWSFYAFISIPLIAYQFSYWLPSNLNTFYNFFFYTFGWFSLLGPVYVIYKIPEWGVSIYSLFGVLSGLFSAFLMSYSFYIFKERFTFRTLLAIFFYFPYTIVLNTIIVISLVRIMFSKKVRKERFMR